MKLVEDDEVNMWQVMPPVCSVEAGTKLIGIRYLSWQKYGNGYFYVADRYLRLVGINLLMLSGVGKNNKCHR